MKNKSLGFTLIELLIVITIIGILATTAIPYFFTSLAKSRDTERISNVNNVSRIILLNGAENDGSAYIRDLASLKALLVSRGKPYPESGSGYCYFYGHKDINFFVAVRSESNPTEFIVDGTKQAKDDFMLETVLQELATNCAPLTSPTSSTNYEVFYLQ